MRAICLLVFLLCVEFVASQEKFPFTFAVTCAANETVRIRETRITAIKDAILAKLHLPEPPSNPRRPTVVNKSTYSDYEAAVQASNVRSSTKPQECGRDTFYAKQITVYIPISYLPVIPSADMFEWGPVDLVAKRDIDVSLYQDYVPPTSYRLLFDLNLNYDTLVWSSDLRLYKRKKVFSDLEAKQEKSPLGTENVEVYQVFRTINDNGKEVRNVVLLTSKDVDVHTDRYESFDVTHAVRTSLSEGFKVLELEVVVKCPQSLTTGLAFLPRIEFVTTKENNTVQLVVATLKEEEIEQSDDYNKVRTKRQNEIDSEFCLNNPDEHNCCLRKLEVNFKRDLGWTWVIAPKSFSPNFCEGLCPFFWPSVSMSTSLLIRYREMNPTAAVAPCCATASLKPLTLLMVIDGRIILEELSDMIVESCICR